MAGSDSIFREARLIIRHCINPTVRETLRARTDECKEVFDRFNVSASRDDFQILVPLWTRMLLAMDAAGPWVEPPNPVGGKVPLPAAA